MVSWQERLVHALELFSRIERGFYSRDHWKVLVGDDLGVSTGQEGELVGQLLALLCSCVDGRFRKLFRIHARCRRCDSQQGWS